MESVTIIFSMFRLVFVEILSYGVRYTLIINKMRVVSNSKVMHNFETGGWKKPEFNARNLVKMIGGNVNKGRNESTKTNFSPV